MKRNVRFFVLNVDFKVGNFEGNLKFWNYYDFWTTNSSECCLFFWMEPFLYEKNIRLSNIGARSRRSSKKRRLLNREGCRKKWRNIFLGKMQNITFKSSTHATIRYQSPICFAKFVLNHCFFSQSIVFVLGCRKLPRRSRRRRLNFLAFTSS